MSGYAAERAGNAMDTVERQSSILENINDVRGDVNNTMLRLRRFTMRHFGPVPPQPQDPKTSPAELTGAVSPTLSQFNQSVRVTKADLNELNSYITHMENSI